MTAHATRRDDDAAEPAEETAGPPPVLNLPDELPPDRVDAALHVLAGIFTRRLLRRLAATPPANDNGSGNTP
jgi:hypothetical protein